jgi:SAM-dependent methyltransferase
LEHCSAKNQETNEPRVEKVDERSYIRVPSQARFSVLQKLVVGTLGLSLSPMYWLLASKVGVPGLSFRAECAKLGLRLIFSRHNVMPVEFVYLCLFGPMDSTRYFEFDFLWHALSSSTLKDYLDVSSPRLFPAILLYKKPSCLAHLVNPDPKDLHRTRQLVESMGFQNRCRLHECLISDAPLSPASFDVISSISVMEHIPDDREALRKMWSFLRPGGRLLITVPCASRSSEQYIDRNEYGILASERNGFFFWQRFYDRSQLEDRFFTVTGPPKKMVVYGEKERGSFQKNAARKRADRYYPLWREPYMMACEYRHYPSIEELPGEGVIALEFIKS